MKSKRTSKNTFPFNQSTHIKLLRYADIRKGTSNDRLIKNGKLDIGTVQQEVELTSVQKDSLFSLLHNYVDTVKHENNQEVASRCGYAPLHGVAFYKGSKPIAYFEICFTCSAVNMGGVDFGFRCPNRYCMMMRFFFDAGITDMDKSHGCW